MHLIYLLLAIPLPQIREAGSVPRATFQAQDQIPEFYERSLGSPYEVLAWLDLPNWARKHPLAFDIFGENSRVKERLLWEHAAIWPDSYWSLRFREAVLSFITASDSARKRLFPPDITFYAQSYGRLLRDARLLSNDLLSPQGVWIPKEQVVEDYEWQAVKAWPWGSHGRTASRFLISGWRTIVNEDRKYASQWTPSDRFGDFGTKSSSDASYDRGGPTSEGVLLASKIGHTSNWSYCEVGENSYGIKRYFGSCGDASHSCTKDYISIFVNLPWHQPSDDELIAVIANNFLSASNLKKGLNNPETLEPFPVLDFLEQNNLNLLVVTRQGKKPSPSQLRKKKISSAEEFRSHKHSKPINVCKTEDVISSPRVYFSKVEGYMPQNPTISRVQGGRLVAMLQGYEPGALWSGMGIRMPKVERKTATPDWLISLLQSTPAKGWETSQVSRKFDPRSKKIGSRPFELNAILDAGNKLFKFRAEKGYYLIIEGVHYLPPYIEFWNLETGSRALLDLVSSGPLQLVYRMNDETGSDIAFGGWLSPNLNMVKAFPSPVTSSYATGKISVSNALEENFYENDKDDQLNKFFIWKSKSPEDQSSQAQNIRRKVLPPIFWGMAEFVYGRTSKAVELWNQSNPELGSKLLVHLAQSQMLAKAGDTKGAYNLLNRVSAKSKNERRNFLKEWLLANWAIENSRRSFAEKHMNNMFNSLLQLMESDPNISNFEVSNAGYDFSLDEWIRLRFAEKFLDQSFFTSSRRSLSKIFKAAMDGEKYLLAVRAFRLLLANYEKSGSISQALDQAVELFAGFLVVEDLVAYELNGLVSDVTMVSLRSGQLAAGRNALYVLKRQIETMVNSHGEDSRTSRILKEIDLGIGTLSATLVGGEESSENLAESILGILRGSSPNAAKDSKVNLLLEKLKEDLGDPYSTGAALVTPAKYDGGMGQKLQLLGETLLASDNHHAARDVLYFAKQVLNANYGKSSFRAIECAGMQAKVSLALGETSKAIKDVTNLIEEVRRKGDPNSALELKLRSLFATALLKAGKSSESAKEWRKLVKDQGKKYGENSIEVALSFKNLAGSLLASGKQSNAIEALGNALNATSIFFEENLFLLTEPERLEISRQEQTFQKLLEVASSQAKLLPEEEAQLFSQHLNWKGRSMRIHFLLKSMEKSNDEVLKDVLMELREVRAETSHLFLGGEKKASGAEKRITELSSRRQTLELELNRLLKESNRKSGALKPREGLEYILTQGALVDYVMGEETVLAWVASGDSQPKLVRLGDKKNIKQAVVDFLSSASKGRGGKALSLTTETPGEKLRKLIWDPLVTHLGETKRIFLSPDSFLGLVPFDALPKNNQVLLEEYTFSHLPDLTWAILENSKENVQGQLLVLGHASYGPMRSEAQGFEAWEPLPGTASEAQKIQSIFSAIYPASETVLLVENYATEKNLRDAIPGRSWVHLATHGFFRPDLGTDISDSLANKASERVARESPGLLAGIVVAGANNQQLGIPSDDGYLSAEEFCALDLSQCQLLTLSACESGKGESIPGEGLISMTRSAKQAGAKSVISSLWRVDDYFTKVLMEKFYTHYWVEEESAAQALRNAKLEMLQENRADYEADHPEYWAAFIYHGI